MRNWKKLALVILSFLELPIIILAQSSPEFHRYKFEETMRLGDDKPLSREYLLGSPWLLCTDSRNRIYLADTKVAGIRVYDPKGIYLKTLGGSGRGPGEFTEKTSMTITDDDRLIIFDRMQMRITEFDVSRTSLEYLGNDPVTYSSPEKKMITPLQILALKNGEFVIAYRHYYHPKSVFPSSDSVQIDKILNFVTSDFRQITDHALPLDKLGDMENPYIEHLIGFPFNTLSMAAQDEGTVVVAPHYYEGTLYLVEKQKNGRWKQKQTLRGFTEHPNAITYYPNSTLAPDEAHVSGGHAAVVHNSSLGIFFTPDGTLVHLSFLLYDGKRQVFVEKFDADLNLIAYGPIQNLSTHKTRPSRYKLWFQWIDSSGQFFIYDFRDLENMAIRRGYIKEIE